MTPQRFLNTSNVTKRVRVDLGGGRYAERVETSFGGAAYAARASTDPNVIDVEGEVVEETRRGDRDKPRLEEPE